MRIYCKCELAYRLHIQNTQEQKHEGQSNNFYCTVPYFFSCSTMSRTSCICPRRQPFIFQVIAKFYHDNNYHELQKFDMLRITTCLCAISEILHLIIFLPLIGHVLYSVAMEAQGYLTLVCSLKLAPRVYRFRASFCPLLSLEKGEFIGIFLLKVLFSLSLFSIHF